MLLAWSKRFETGIPLVDSQHHGLFDLLNQLAARFDDGGVPGESAVALTLQELADYAARHFSDEEAMMQQEGIDPGFFALHQMEHHSFSFELERLQLHGSVDEDEVQTAERLVRFITSWLVYHILGTDQSMAAQLRDIAGGTPAGEAYLAHKAIQRDPATMQLILDAVLELWRDAAERCRQLEASSRRDAIAEPPG